MRKANSARIDVYLSCKQPGHGDALALPAAQLGAQLADLHGQAATPLASRDTIGKDVNRF